MTRSKEKHWLKTVTVVHIYFCIFLAQASAQNEFLRTFLTAPTWKESWDGHIENISVHSLDDHVAFFSAFHGNETLNTNELRIVSVPNSLRWKFASKLLNFTTATGSLGIYVIMSDQQYKNMVQEDEVKLTQSCILSNNSVPSSKCYLIEIKSNKNPSRILQSDIHEEIQAVDHLINGSSLKKTNLVSGWRIHDILVYYRLVQAGKISTANKLKIQLLNKTTNYPQKNSNVFLDWFLPIYEHHGGSKTVAKFLEIQLAFLKTRSNSTESRDISCGQFIHLWSQAAETDLRDLAYKAFGWAHWKEYMEQFQLTRANTRVLNYQDVYPNASLYEPPHHWVGHSEGHTENLTLVFTDGNIAAYYGPLVSPKLTWPYKLCSEWWSYAKQNYELVGPDPLLYLLMHAGDVDANTGSAYNVKLRKQYHNRLAIDFAITRINILDHFENSMNGAAITFGTAIKALLKERLTWTDSEPDSQVELIIGYDVLIGTENDALAAYYKNIANDLRINWPRAAAFTFRDWFYPIYSRHGGKAVLQKFFGLLTEHWDRKNAHPEQSLQVGELVHWWSGAAGEDLSKLAIQAFGWSSKDNADLAHARVKYPQLQYTHVSSKLLHDWKEHWAGHEKNLTLVYSNEHVAFYFDTKINSTTNISFPFDLISAGWKYAKETYGGVSEDPLLFVVLHQRSSACIWSRMSMYLDRDFENRNVIDCGVPEYDKNDPDNLKVEDMLMAALGQLILSGAKRTGNWPGTMVSGNSMATILVYDILLGTSQIDHAHRFLIKELSDLDTTPENRINWFREWYYPIYTKYGQAQGINSFLEILHTSWPQLDQDYTQQLDLGTWVHFWSAAVDEYLWYEAAEFLGWGVRNHRLYLNARDAHPLIQKGASDRVGLKIPTEDWTNFWAESEEALSLAYVDGHVAVYFDSLMDPSISWPFKLLSDSWRYVKKTFGAISPDPILYVVLHNGPHSTSQNYCDVFRNYYASFVLGHRTLLDCGWDSHLWDSPESSDTLVFHVAKLIRQNMKQTKSWVDFRVSFDNAETMVTFDINIGIGRNEAAAKVFQIDKSLGLNGLKSMWWRNWFFPIYIKYGRGRVIDKYHLLLLEHFPKADVPYDYARYLNTGEFIHFWSGAAGVSLKTLSRHVFNWTEKYEDEYTKAVQDFPLITYKDSGASEIENPETLAYFENQFGHSEFLYQAYADSQVEVYLDLDVSLQANWTFTFLAHSWQYTTLMYEILQLTTKTSLNVFLHSKKHDGCRTNVKSNSCSIDCGSISSEAWTLDSPENRETILNQYVNLLQKRAEQLAEKGSLTLALFKKMQKFDIYLRLGMFSEAYVLLSKAFTQSSVKSAEPVFYVRDWLLPIYTRTGGVTVFSRFLSLVVEHWNSKRNHYKKPMNVGQSLHFWSSAADENLFALARTTYGRNSLYEAQFTEARTDFRLPRYACYDCHAASWALSSSKNDDLAIGLSLGLTCIFIASIFTLVCLYRRKVQSLKHQIRQLTSDEISEFFQGNSNAEEDGRNGSVDAKPFNTEYEIPRDQLDIHLNHVLGSGEFGLVLRGILKATPGTSEENTVVAVKTVKPNVDVTYFKAFLTELKVMCFLGKHGNIVSLLGAITVNIKNREVFVALELCPHGDLLQFLKNCRSSFKDLIGQAGRNRIETQVFKCEEPSTLALAKVDYVNTPNYINADHDCNSIEISSLTLLEWSTHVTQGMAYIASKNVIHGDLAARNVLLTADRVAKISDFGLSRQLLNYSTYMKKSKTPVPWRWMAIESLREMNFSVQSDVWAFGVTLYEIFSLGMTPYAGWTWDLDFVDKLVAGHRLSSPEFGNNEIYQIMLECMKGEAKERINYAEISEKLQRIKDTLFIQQFDKNEV